MENSKLFRVFAESILGKPLESFAPTWLSGWECVAALWPLNERFRPAIERIRAIEYDAAFTGEADAAIELLLVNPDASWDNLSSGAWRVLLERQQQAIMVALANEREGNPVMPIPPGFSPQQITVSVTLFLMHGMNLPWSPADRYGFEIPPGSALASLRPH